LTIPTKEPLNQNPLQNNKHPKPAHSIWDFSVIALQTQNHKPLVSSIAQTRGSSGFVELFPISQLLNHYHICSSFSASNKTLVSGTHYCDDP